MGSTWEDELQRATHALARCRLERGDAPAALALLETLADSGLEHALAADLFAHLAARSDDDAPRLREHALERLQAAVDAGFDPRAESRLDLDRTLAGDPRYAAILVRLQ
jgi:hypothetical protein